MDLKSSIVNTTEKGNSSIFISFSVNGNCQNWVQETPIAWWFFMNKTSEKTWSGTLFRNKKFMLDEMT